MCDFMYYEEELRNKNKARKQQVPEPELERIEKREEERPIIVNA